MKISKIRRLCYGMRRFAIIDAMDGGQWISDGYNAWKVCGMQLDEEALPHVFDLSNKQARQCTFTREAASHACWDGERYAGIEETLIPMGDVTMWDEQLLALRGTEPERLVFLPRSALGPVKVTDDTEFRARRWTPADSVDAEAMLIAVYNGMFCDALIPPMETDSAETIVRFLRRVVDIPIWDGKRRPAFELVHNSDQGSEVK